MKSLFLAAAFLLSFVGNVFADEKPSNKEWEQALSDEIPGFFKVEDFDIEASQNLGNQIDPFWGIRFKADVSSKEDLYVRKSRKDNVIFVDLKTKKGMEMPIYGKIYANLYQGSWKMDVKIDGNVFSDLGKPLSQHKGQVIVRGSKEERDYYAKLQAEKEKKEAEERRRKRAALVKQRAEDARIFSGVVGKWKDRNSVKSYAKNGTFYAEMERMSGGWDHSKLKGLWRIQNGEIIQEAKQIKKKGSNKWEPVDEKWTGKVESVTDDTMEIRWGGGRKWKSKRLQDDEMPEAEHNEIAEIIIGSWRWNDPKGTGSYSVRRFYKDGTYYHKSFIVPKKNEPAIPHQAKRGTWEVKDGQVLVVQKQHKDMTIDGGWKDMPREYSGLGKILDHGEETLKIEWSSNKGKNISTYEKTKWVLP